jgi:hypothetical protein
VGIALSLLLIAAGAILAFAVTATTSGIDLNTVGWILMGIGVLGLVLTLIFWNTWFGAGAIRGRRTVVTDDPYAAQRPVARRTVVEEDAGAAPPPP